MTPTHRLVWLQSGLISVLCLLDADHLDSSAPRRDEDIAHHALSAVTDAAVAVLRQRAPSLEPILATVAENAQSAAIAAGVEDTKHVQWDGDSKVVAVRGEPLIRRGPTGAVALAAGESGDVDVPRALAVRLSCLRAAAVSVSSVRRRGGGPSAAYAASCLRDHFAALAMLGAAVPDAEVHVLGTRFGGAVAALRRGREETLVVMPAQSVTAAAVAVHSRALALGAFG